MNEVQTNMNMNFLLASGAFPSVESQVMAPGANAPEAGTGPAFGNLLDLVSDMQVADEQSPAGADFLNERSSELFDPKWQDLASGAAQAGIAQVALSKELASGMPAKDVGRAVEDLKVSTGGTKPAQELLIEAQGLDTLSRADLAAKTQSHSESNAESARVWAAAIATGDLKSVSLEKEPEIAQAKPETGAAFLTKGAKAEISGAREGLSVSTPSFDRDAKVGQATFGVKTEAPLPSSKAPTAAVTPSAEPEGAKGPAAVVASVGAKTGSDAGSNSNTGSNSGSNANSGSRERPEAPEGFSRFRSFERAESTLAKPTVKRSQSGGEFLLNHATADKSAAPAATALVGSAALGKTGDRRISPESLDFVADKVDALKSQGGGRLKVEMSPRDLGSIEIRVSVARGQMKVEVLAEKPETLKALHASKAELATKLDQIGPATSLDMGELRGKTVLSAVREPSTGDLLGLRTNASVAEAPSSGTGTGGLKALGGAERSSDFLSGRDFQQEQREERRERAMDQWEDLAERRKSA